MAQQRWDDTLYVKIYELVVKGYGRRRVAQELGLSVDTLRYWHENKPALAEIIDRARSQYELQKMEAQSIGNEPFFDYVYKRLPEDLMELWKELEGLGRGRNAQERVRKVMEGHSVRHKQHIFVHSMVTNNFSIAEACRMTGIPRSTWDWWVKDDKEFVKLVDEVLKLKKDWIESALMRLVQKGDKTAVIFANRTQNRDRGYDPKITIRHEGAVVHGHVDIDTLDLDLDTKRKLLEAYRKRKAAIEGQQQSQGNGFNHEPPREVRALEAADEDD